MNKSWCTLPILGLIITACYLLGATWLLFDRVEQLKTMPLNEIGDFLAGIFGALAFFWLVIGYFMQNSELKLNRKSLDKQIEEFEKSVSSQLAHHDFIKKKEQDEFVERLFRAKPILKVSYLKLYNCTDEQREIHTSLNANYDQIRFSLSNFGGDIFNIKVEISFNNEEVSSTYPKLAKNENIDVNIENDHLPEQTVMTIYFENNMGIADKSKYFIDSDASEFDPPEQFHIGEGHYEYRTSLKLCEPY